MQAVSLNGLCRLQAVLLDACVFKQFCRLCRQVAGLITCVSGFKVLAYSLNRLEVCLLCRLCGESRLEGLLVFLIAV